MILTKVAAALGVIGLLATFVGALLSARGISFKKPKDAPAEAPEESGLWIDDRPVKHGLLWIAAGTVLQIFGAIPNLFK